ncbi:hypothetical protein B2J93_3173 [Marssonina coronariae]|uniref:Uncharacterized protein n=1 Tax=Diplocarpon coronariae TaxID=2795749 RepID=A0A218Z557_9HELO|nr:hypothetical protein B2J93_3173 [Marssonina coronariae]
MSEATNTKLMDTEPGGENTQYESQNTFTRPPKKSTGQLGADPNEKTEADVQQAKEKRERGEKTAENIRYGEAISEHGFGGETVGNSGEAGAGEAILGQSRREQGYGEGSGVGG